MTWRSGAKGSAQSTSLRGLCDCQTGLVVYATWRRSRSQALDKEESSLLCTQTNEIDHDLLRYRTSRRTWDTRFEFFFKQRPVRIASTNLPFPQSTRRFRLKIDFYACAITLFVLDYSSRLRGALHRRASSWRQRRGKGAAALVAGVFRDEVFLVQLRVFCGHDCKRGSVRLSGWHVDDPTVSLGDRTGLQRSWHVGWSIRF